MKKTISPYLRALTFVWRSAPGWTIASIVLAVVMSTLPIVQLYLTKLTIDSIVIDGNNVNNEGIFKDALFYIILTGLAFLANSFVSIGLSLVKKYQAALVSEHMYRVIQSQSIAVDLEYYENPQYYDVLHRAQGEAHSRPLGILDELIKIGYNGLSLLTMVILLFAFHWSIPFVLLIATLPGLWSRIHFDTKLFHWQRRRTPESRKIGYFHEALTSQIHAKEIRLFKLGQFFKDNFLDLTKVLRGERLAIDTKRSFTDMGTQVFTAMVIFGSYSFIAYRAVQGAITIGSLVMYFQAFQKAINFFHMVLQGIAGLHAHKLFLSNLFEFLDLKPQMVIAEHPQKLPQSIQEGVQFHNVSFQYPKSKRKALDKLNFKIRAGEVVAFVGENGAGKTTLIKLLSRLYDPNHGHISLDGTDIRDFDIAKLQQKISVIFQDYVKYPLTVKENIWLGNIEAPLSQESIHLAAQQAGIDKVIAELPQHYETILGRRLGDGEELSIGEWQKIALARAFLRHSPIIVLDEPTSAMDAKAEYELFERFRKLIKDQTAILISHRFSTVKMADCIYVLENGRIAERGNHKELISRNGIYARLYEMQARKYLLEDSCA